MSHRKDVRIANRIEAKKGWYVLSLLVSMCFLFTANLVAQTGSGGTIQGTVLDPSNAVIADAQITVTNIQTGVITKARSTSDGYYSVPALIPGIYTVEVSRDGFKNYVQQNVSVDALKVVGLNIKLSLGETTESITVTSAPPPLQTENAALNVTLENDTYMALPLNMGGSQRDPTAFAALTPGYAGGGRSGTYNGAGGSSNGDSSSGAVTYLDGVPITQGDNRQISLAVSVDAVDQFQVTSSGADAAQTGMGSQNYNIKHGTNTFHGSLYDFVRNTAFDSWDFFAKDETVATANGGKTQAPKPAEHQDELGMTFGGPIQRNKMFLFVAGEIYRYTAYESPTLMSVPTAAMRQGDFSALDWPIYDPTTLTVKGSDYTVSQYPNNQIPAGEISSISQKMLSFLPAPSNSNLANNYLAPRPTGNSNYEISERFDYVLTPQQRISILGNVGKRGFIGYDYATTAVLPVPYMDAQIVTEFFDSGIIEHTYAINPNLVNQLKFGYVRAYTPESDPSNGISRYEASTLGISNIPTGQAQTTFPAASFSGGEYGYSTWYSPSGATSTNNSFVWHDDLSWVHGKHLVTAGFDLQFIENNAASWNTISSPLSLAYSTATTAGFATTSGTSLTTKSGDPFASFLIGGVSSTSLTLQNFSTLGTRTRPFSPYIQDDWKVTPSLTLNLGLRWDHIPPMIEVHNRGSFMNPNIINSATNSFGAMMYLGNGQGSCNCETAAPTYYANFAPRLGLSYTVTPKTVIRSAFGISYARNGTVAATTGTTGFTTTTSYASSINGEQPAFYLNSNLGNTAFPAYSSTFTQSPTVNAGNYLNVSTGTYPTASSVTMATPYRGSRPPTVYNWNLGIQRSLTNDLSVTVTYAGSASHFLSSSKSSGADYLNPKYLVIGKYLGDLPASMDSATSQTFLADAQTRYPGISIPYSNFGGASGTISQMLRRFPQYSSVSDTWGAGANADYHGLQVVVAQRAWHDFSFAGNFSWSKTMDNTGSYRAVGVIPGNVITGGRTVNADQLEHAVSVYDQPFIFKFYGSYKLPFGPNKIGSNNMVARQVGRQWQLSWIYSLTSGRPLTPTGSCTLSGQGTCFPSYNPNFTGKVRINGKYGNGYLAGMSNPPRYINSDAFMAPAGYEIGNAARSAPYGLRDPHSAELDLALMRDFNLYKALKFNFRAEVFNVTNNVDFYGIGVSYPCTSGSDYGIGGGTCTLTSSQSFGTVSSQSNSARDWQFSGRFSF